MGDFAAGALTTLIIVAVLFVYLEWRSRRPRKARQRGNYFDARQPFRIEYRGPARGPERSDDLIAREARRIMRRTYGVDERSRGAARAIEWPGPPSRGSGQA